LPYKDAAVAAVRTVAGGGDDGFCFFGRFQGGDDDAVDADVEDALDIDRVVGGDADEDRGGGGVG